MAQNDPNYSPFFRNVMAVVLVAACAYLLFNAMAPKKPAVATAAEPVDVGNGVTIDPQMAQRGRDQLAQLQMSDKSVIPGTADGVLDVPGHNASMPYIRLPGDWEPPDPRPAAPTGHGPAVPAIETSTLSHFYKGQMGEIDLTAMSMSGAMARPTKAQLAQVDVDTERKITAISTQPVQTQHFNLAGHDARTIEYVIAKHDIYRQPPDIQNLPNETWIRRVEIQLPKATISVFCSALPGNAQKLLEERCDKAVAGMKINA